MLQISMWLGRGRQEMCTEFWKKHVVETIYIKRRNSLDMWEVDQDCIKWWPLVLVVAVL
jgi:hypothetical protein